MQIVYNGKWMIVTFQFFFLHIYLPLSKATTVITNTAGLPYLESSASTVCCIKKYLFI